ncbi:MAG: TauD/TfdA family dioxygenase, partial [Variovorax sp.]|nr:TauD/TfdA family dioxygenase [Variovorax sp.]
MTDAYHGKSNWLAADMKDPAEWMIQLSEAQIADLDRALDSAKSAGVTIDKLTKESFPLEVFDKLVPEIQDRLENGRGIVVLRGLPAEKYSRDELRLMYWGMGLYLGTAVSQSSKGDLLGDVR